MYATTPGASIVIWSLVVSGLSSKTLGVMDSQDGPEQISASFLLVSLIPLFFYVSSWSFSHPNGDELG